MSSAEYFQWFKAINEILFLSLLTSDTILGVKVLVLQMMQCEQCK